MGRRFGRTFAPGSCGPQFINGRAHCFRDLEKSLIAIRPLCDGTAIGGRRHEFAEWGAMPVAWSEYDRDHDRLADGVTLHRPGHLDLVAIVGREKVGADQKEDDLVGLDVRVDGVVEVAAGDDPAIVPGLDHALALQHRQLRFELVAERLVFVRVGEEQRSQ